MKNFPQFFGGWFVMFPTLTIHHWRNIKFSASEFAFNQRNLNFFLLRHWFCLLPASRQLSYAWKTLFHWIFLEIRWQRPLPVLSKPHTNTHPWPESREYRAGVSQYTFPSVRFWVLILFEKRIFFFVSTKSHSQSASSSRKETGKQAKIHSVCRARKFPVERCAQSWRDKKQVSGSKIRPARASQFGNGMRSVCLRQSGKPFLIFFSRFVLSSVCSKWGESFECCAMFVVGRLGVRVSLVVCKRHTGEGESEWMRR